MMNQLLVDIDVQNKLKALQEYSYKANPGESIEIRDIDGKQVSLVSRSTRLRDRYLRKLGLQ